MNALNMKLFINILCIFIGITGFTFLVPNQKSEATTQLTLLEAEEVGITFQNTIQESGRYNHIFWENVYHGAGVAIGDINNDGLADVFFSGNQVQDELYLNKGNFQFQNITQNLNAPQNHYWSSGVTMADVNADGWLDIYVCKSGPSLDAKERKNLLYINNKDNTFSEQAVQIGLADEGYSMQTVFFDMDKDGDLDAYVMNQPPSTVQEKKQNVLYNTSCEDFTDNLYRNDNGRFTKITQAAGLQNCAYGLGIVATDINKDGWTDLYVTNDYFISDHLYINQKDGTFKDEGKQSFAHESLYAMGVDVADINNDGSLDVFTADMSAADHYRNKANMPSMNRQRFQDIVASGNNYQYMFNALQLNNGQGKFSEIAQMAGVANTDWSWSTLLVDVDNDTQKDLLISNGIKRDVRFVDGLNKLTKALKDGTIKLSEILSATPSQPLKNFAFQNKQGNRFKDVSEDWGFAVESFSSGMAYGDLDNDGDVDLIVNNVDKAPFIFENNSSNNFISIQLKGTNLNPFAYGAKATLEIAGQTQFAELSPTRGYLSATQPRLFFGLGNHQHIDKLTIDWGNGQQTLMEKIPANQFLTIRIAESKTAAKTPIPQPATLFKQLTTQFPNFKHKETAFNPFQKEVLLPHKLSQLGPALAVEDVNGDGLEDFFIGGASGQNSELWLQKTNGTFQNFDANTFALDANYEDVAALFFDANNDGAMDLYVASGSNEFGKGDSELQDRLYINHGGFFIHDVEALPTMLMSTSTVKASDFDGDGDKDLLVGGLMEQQGYPKSAPSYLLENRNGKFIDITKQSAKPLQQIGMVRDALWTDVDLDGDQDLMVVGEWMNITCLLNEKSQFVLSEKSTLNQTMGMWHSIEGYDFDGDGDEDYLVGNLGLNNKFKSNDKNGFHLFANDFDENGITDIVLGKEKNGALLPVRGRECSSEQMPFIAEKFTTFHDFASASLEDIYTPEKLKQSAHYEIQYMESIYLENKGQGDFHIHTLPLTTQRSVTTDFVIHDFDKDGNMDVVTVGNKYETEVETARYDAGMGLFLRGDGKGEFQAIPTAQSGLFIRANMRDAALLKIQDKEILLVANNDGPLSTFEIRQNKNQ